MKHKKQHWIPQSYLKAWCDPDPPSGHEPFVWCFAKDGSSVKQRAPKNIFYETEMYTIRLEDGTRKLEIEHGLAGIEDAFVGVRGQKLEKSKELSADEELLLKAFIGAMQVRARGHAQHMQRQWKEALEKMDRMKAAIRQLRDQGKKMPPLGLGPTKGSRAFSYREVQQLAEGPIGPMVATEVSVQIRFLSPMCLAILCANDSLGFITSDMPCVWFDPQAHLRSWPMNGPGIAFPTIEITLPLSPTQMALLNWQGVTGYMDISVEQLDDLNRRTRAFCDEYFVVRRNETRKIWLELGEPPEQDGPPQ